ncbi:SLC13 family permease [Corynebacterium sp. L4756]|uniref:SLC13 family permease n=1 Tax=unclassified Corynebacterium TaxID=2624378 RepID=UPI00374CFF0F
MIKRANFTAILSVLAMVMLPALGFVELATLRELVGRLVPIFVFVIAISIVVNVSSQVGLFEEVVARMEKLAPKHKALRPMVLWSLLILLALVVTVFLSLDTTAVMITALAIPLARRNNIPVVGVAFAVVWIANIASMPLPVSNLTNLLALGSDAFAGTLDYLSYSWKPALMAIILAVAAAGIFTLLQSRISRNHEISSRSTSSQCPRSRLLIVCAGVVVVLIPVLVTPISYWLSTSVAAIIILIACVPRHSNLISADLVPWNSLLLVTVVSTVATLTHSIGLAEWLNGLNPANPDSYPELLAIAGAGGLAANLMNNIPAFLFLEPLVSTPASYIALLIGVNAAPIITPWASLATLLWHDQLRRAGVHISWGKFMLLGCILAPVVVLLPVAMLV